MEAEENSILVMIENRGGRWTVMKGNRPDTSEAMTLKTPDGLVRISRGKASSLAIMLQHFAETGELYSPFKDENTRPNPSPDAPTSSA